MRTIFLIIPFTIGLLYSFLKNIQPTDSDDDSDKELEDIEYIDYDFEITSDDEDDFFQNYK
jgi:hypothetical protein